MSIKNKTGSRIVVDDNYYFTFEGRSMTLYREGVRDPIGYFTQFPPMIKRIIQLRATERVQDSGRSFTMSEYLDILLDERERIETLFEAVQAR